MLLLDIVISPWNFTHLQYQQHKQLSVLEPRGTSTLIMIYYFRKNLSVLNPGKILLWTLGYQIPFNSISVCGILHQNPQ